MSMNPYTYRRAFALSVLAAAAGQVCAQTADTAAEPKGPQLEEVIVTAQKVAQPASKTPISMAVITGESLKAAGTTDPRSLTDSVANVHVGTEAGKLQITIRGVMNTDATEKGDPSTAFHVDGMYVGRPEAQLGSFMDLERVELLRGPQGTLYGRNATGGAVNVITNKPTQVFGGKANVEFGNFGTRRLEGVLNVPVNDTLALRGAISQNRHNTYLKAGPDMTVPLESQDDVSGRLHALFKFSPQTTWLLTAENAQQGGDGGTPVPITNFFPAATNTAVANGNNRVGPGSTFDGSGNLTSVVQPIYSDQGNSQQRTVGGRFVRNPYDNNTQTSLRSEFKTDLGFADLTYQVARMRATYDYLFDGTFFSFPFFAHATGFARQVSNEVRLNSNKPGPLRWVVGAYAYREDQRRDDTYNTVINPFFTFVLTHTPTIQNRSKALFGQTTYSLTDSLRLITGLRYTKDIKSGEDSFNGWDRRGDNAAKFSKVNYRLGLDYDLSKQTFLYGAFATGYKAGGFNTDANSGTYRPEQLAALSAGVKTRQMGGRLQLNAEVFLYDYKDMQNASTFCTGNTSDTCGSYTVNVGKVRSKGLDFDGQYLVTENDRVNFALGLLKSEFQDFVPVNTPTLRVDFTGQSTDRSPSSTARLGYTHTFVTEAGQTVAAYLGTRFSSSYYISDPSAGIRYEQPSFHKSDAHVTFRPASDKYFVQAYVKNIENTITMEARVPGSFHIGDPRTFGVRLGTQF